MHVSKRSVLAVLLLAATSDNAEAFQIQSSPSARRHAPSSVTSPLDSAVVLDLDVAAPSIPGLTSEDTSTVVNDKPRTGAMMDLQGIALSGLKGQALSLTNDDFPKANELRAAIPQDCFESDTATSLGYLGVSLAGTAACTAVGANMLDVLNPGNPLTWPIWAAYSAVTGTVAMGLWVLAHECGHGAFSKNKNLQDAVGYMIHSMMLVPYYSWQRSHAVHHQYTNHMELGMYAGRRTHRLCRSS